MARCALTSSLLVGTKTVPPWDLHLSGAWPMVTPETAKRCKPRPGRDVVLAGNACPEGQARGATRRERRAGDR